MLTNDESLEQQLLSEPWICYSRYANIHKIKSHLPSLKYFIQEEETLKNYCTDKVFKHVMSKKNLFESQNAKSLERAGVPSTYIREFLLKLFVVDNVEESFAQKYKFVFKERDPSCVGEFVPYFTGFKTLAESLPVDFLNNEGIQALKEILWLLNSVITTIEFSPTIIKITSILLIFCNKEETYCIMRNLLDMNYNNNETFKLRWHLRFSYNDNKKTISSLNECIREISYKSGREIYEHLESINFPPEKLYEDMVYGLLFDYLNFEGIIRLIPFFMVEGVKCLYRLAYSIIKTIKGDLVKIKSADEILKNARERSKQINDISKLFNLSYTFKLTRYNNNYAFQEMPDRDLFFGKRNSYYLPSFSVCSYILKESEITKIWAILPQNIRMKDAKMIFNTQTNGYSLSSIYSLTDTYGFENEILFILETLNGEVFAGYMSNMFRHTNGKYQRPIQSLLITIRPNLALYESNKTADDIIYCENSYFMFGGGPEGAALVVDNNLKSGYSNNNNCFGVPPIALNGEFTIKKMEIYIIG